MILPETWVTKIEFDVDVRTSLEFMKEYQPKNINTLIHSYYGIIDLDYLMWFNDQYGHEEGDKYLMAYFESVDKVLKKYYGENIIISRIGGDEVAVYAFDNKNLNILDFEKVKEDITKELTNYMSGLIEKYPESNPPKAGVSIGVNSFTNKKRNITKDDLFIIADKSLYKAKKYGRSRVEYEEVNIPTINS